MMGEVSPAGSNQPDIPAGQLRASHQDRDRVVELLQVAAGDGRLTPEELDQRLEVALTARTYGELAVLTADLPASAGTGAMIGTGAPPAPKDVVRVELTSGHTKRDGRWVVPRRMEIRVTSGHVTLDFTQAVITRPTLELVTEVRSGHVTLITKPGIVVDSDDVAVRSGRVHVREPWGTVAPVSLRIALSGKVGSGHISARPPRRTFWQWLRRAPRPYAITAR